MSSPNPVVSTAHAIPSEMPMAWIRAFLRRLKNCFNREILPEILLISANLVVIWIAVFVQLGQYHQEVLQQNQANSVNLVHLAAKGVERSVSLIDEKLLLMQSSYTKDPDHFSIHFWKNVSTDDIGNHIKYLWIGPSGNLIDQSEGWVSPIKNWVDKDVFTVLRDREGNEIYISKPFRIDATDEVHLLFARKLLYSDGRFGGVLVASLNVEWLMKIYEKFDVQKSSFLLIGMDGIVRSHTPFLAGVVGRDFRKTDLFQNLVSRKMGVQEDAGTIDGKQRLTAFEHLPRIGMIAVVASDMDHVFLNYDFYKWQSFLLGSILTISLLLVGGVLGYHKSRLLYSRRSLTDAVENISQGLVMVDDRRDVPVLNQRAIELLGIPKDLVSRKFNWDDILRWQLESGEFGNGEAGKEIFRKFAEAGGIADQDQLYERVRKTGIILEVRTRNLPDGRIVRTYTDITERKRTEERIRYLAHHDGLTALANRFLLNDRLEQALSRAGSEDKPLAVLCLDLDRFKSVNDTLGHDVGDQLLSHVADRLRAIFRTTDTIARLGGDEFAIIQPDASQPIAASTAARRIIDALSQPFDLSGQQVNISASVGIAIFPEDGHTTEKLMKNADIALYRAKADGRGCYRFFETGMDQVQRERRSLEIDLRAAIHTSQLDLFFQPIFACTTENVMGFEALLRWNHPVRGYVSPADYIPIAEESGLIVPLGLWVLERACSIAMTWKVEERVAVNLSPIQFKVGDLPQQVSAILARTGLPPHRLELEITESLLIEDPDQALSTLRALRNMGIRIALDDFGTGYSSLNYLRRFPFDKLKIDKSFIQSLDVDAGSRPIVEAILAMSRSLKLDVTAEGVETQSQLEILKALSCSEVQGFLLGRPMPSSKIPDFLKTFKDKTSY